MMHLDSQSVTLEQFLGHLSPVEQIRLLMHHPYFTGRCPECRQPIHHSNVAFGRCRCSYCGWHDQDGVTVVDPQQCYQRV